MTLPDEKKTAADLFMAALAFGLVGVFAHIVRYARDHEKDRYFDPLHFIVCTLSASLVSILVGWALESQGVNHELILASAGAVGYVGGPILDIAYRETLAVVTAVFALVRKRLGADEKE